MKKMPVFMALIGVWANSVVLAGEETTIKSRVETVGLFKNGLAVVRCSVTVPGSGTYRLDDVPDPVHGTFWIASDAKVQTQVASRMIEVKRSAAKNLDLQDSLAGRKVTIYFRDGQIPPASGIVEKRDNPVKEKNWDRTYEQSNYYYGPRPQYPNPWEASRFLVLRSSAERGQIFVEQSMISYIQAGGPENGVMQNKPVMIFNVESAGKKPATIVISFLTKGLAWAPSYRVDLSDPKQLVLEQGAVIKNEWRDLEGVPMELISGFPSVRFAHVVSPLATTTNWANFFQQLNQRYLPSSSPISNVMAQQQAYSPPGRSPMTGLDTSILSSGDKVDMYYQPIGKQTLQEGDSVNVSVASSRAPYERIVEWTIPDTRDADGRYPERYQREQDPEKYEDAVWDAVRFRNPFNFPMTTGPVYICAGPKFFGQTLSTWANPGQESVLRITKALSLLARYGEQEEDAKQAGMEAGPGGMGPGPNSMGMRGPGGGEREIIYWGGRPFRKVMVKGELNLANYRKEPVKWIVRRAFSGELIDAQGSPKTALKEEGVYSVNRRNELTWELTLKPSETKTIKYRYYVLASH